MAMANCLYAVNNEADIEMMDKDFHGFVLSSLAGAFFYNPQPFRYNLSQCNNLCYAFIAKLSKYFANSLRIESPTTKVRFTKKETTVISKTVSPERKIIQRSWKEIYRVVKEAEIYLKHCSADDWWIKSIILSNIGEAFVIHVHDLAWSVLCLDLNLLYLQGDTEESYSAAACRKMDDFHAELSNLTRILDEYEDKGQLVLILQEMMEQTQTARATGTINVEEENKVGVAKFLLGKLQASIPTLPASMDDGVAAWLQIDPQDLKLIDKQRPLGQGSYGAVFQGSWHGLKVALKELRADYYDVFQTEAAVLAALHSPFIVQLIGTCVKDESCYLVMELVSSSLAAKIEERTKEDRPPFPPHVAVDIMLQISRGMEYLHGRNMMHLDLKSSNVLVQPSDVPEFRKEGYCRVKLCDFGTASFTLFSLRSSCPRGTLYWRAPEAFAYPQAESISNVEIPRACTYKADVYSFAMTCYEILTGKQPFKGVEPRNLYRLIVQGDRPPLPPSCPSVLADYITKCWDTDPCRRPCFADVSKFMRYMKLLVMRMNEPEDWNSTYSVCRIFDCTELIKLDEGDLDQRASNEEEAPLTRTVDGDISENFHGFPHPQQRRVQPLSPESKRFSSLPEYIQQYSFQEIQNATVNFSTEISRVPCKMWKGILSDGIHVVVKEEQFEISIDEISTVWQLHHPNAARLRGVSAECGSFLAYDDMVQGSLDALLSDKRKSRILDWSIRRKVALGIARFLSYLHDDCGGRFLNIQVNLSNIHLDEGFCPKFCGFGSVIPLDMYSTFLSSSHQRELRMALEFEEFRNVQDFGIVLLELLTGCGWKNILYSLHSIHESIEAEGSRFIRRLIDRDLRGKVDEREAMTWVKLALWCFAMSSFSSPKPSMKKAVLVLKGMSEISTLPEMKKLTDFPRSQRELSPEEQISKIKVTEIDIDLIQSISSSMECRVEEEWMLEKRVERTEWLNCRRNYFAHRGLMVHLMRQRDTFAKNNYNL